ncbi:unnamed protein product [Amoebophrya sp. A120]|nr:unnamed protein product [Amoebophrya sp. A120]|eukprot:GSA120T00006633001.1
MLPGDGGGMMEPPDPYVLTAVLELKNSPPTAGAAPAVMVTCCDYGMEVPCPSQAIKVLAPSRDGVLRYTVGDQVASFPVSDLELAHGQLRDIWIKMATTAQNQAGGSSSSTSTSKKAVQLPAPEIHVVLQYFNREDVKQHTPQVTAKLESLFRKRSQELAYNAASVAAAAAANSLVGGATSSTSAITSSGSAGGAAATHGSIGTSGAGSSTSSPPGGTSRLAGKGRAGTHAGALQVPGTKTTSKGGTSGSGAATAATSSSSGIMHPQQYNHVGGARTTEQGAAGSGRPLTSSAGSSMNYHVEGHMAQQVEELTWNRTEPYRKIIETLEQKVQKYETMEAEYAGSRKQLEHSRDRNKDLTEMLESSVATTSGQISSLRKDYDAVLAENQNLLKQLQEATATIYEGRDQQEQLVKTLGVQKANILLLEGKLKTHEQLGQQIEQYRQHDAQHVQSRSQLQREYSQAAVHFSDALHAVKKEVAKLQEEKSQLQLKVDETGMHLDSANFKLESLQLQSTAELHKTDLDSRTKQNEQADLAAAKSDLLAANLRRDQLEAELARVEEQSRVLLQQERKNLRRAQEDLEKCQEERTTLYQNLTKKQEDTSKNLHEKNHVDLELIKLRNEVNDYRGKQWNYEALHKLNSELNAQVDVLTQSFDELRRTYGRETETAQSDVIPAMKTQCLSMRKENKRLQDDLQAYRARCEMVENEKREMAAQLLSLETRNVGRHAEQEDLQLYEQQLGEKETVNHKQQLLLNQLATKLKDLSEKFDLERGSLQAQATKAEKMVQRLVDLFVQKSYDLQGKYLFDKMDSLDASLAAMLHAKNLQVPFVRLTSGQYLLADQIWLAHFDDKSGRLSFTTRGNALSGEQVKLSADEWFEFGTRTKS